MNKRIHIYQIHARYEKVTLWEGFRKTSKLIATHTSTPFKELSHESKYDNIKEWLKRFGVVAPAYDPTQ